MLQLIFNSSAYYKLYIQIKFWKCIDEFLRDNLTSICDESTNTTTWKDTAYWLAMAIKDSANQFSIFNTLQNPVDVSNLEKDDPCGKSVEWECEWHFKPLICTILFLSLILTILICFGVCHCFLRGTTPERFEKDSASKLSDSDCNFSEEEDEYNESSVFKPNYCLDHSNSVSTPVEHLDELSSIKLPQAIKNERIVLQYQSYIEVQLSANPKPKHVPVGTFLKHTIDYLFSMMDTLLIDSRRSASRSSLTGSVLDLDVGSSHSSLNISPRRPLRRSMQRSRGSSPHLTEPENQLADPLEKKAWEEFIQNIAMNNHLPFDFDVDLNMSASGDNTSRKLLQFFLNHGAINIEQLQVANLIVNYCLYLLSKEIETNASGDCIQFEDFTIWGSMKMGVKVSSANQFDFHMNFHGTDFCIYEILDQKVSEGISPGNIILRAKHTLACETPKCVKNIKIDGQSYVCLSAKTVSSIAEVMIDSALQSLYTGTRSLIDRLPFRMQRSPTANIVLKIDTRTILGLGIPEIKVQIIPAFYLPISGWYQPVSLYASIYSFSQQECKSKVANSQYLSSIPADVLWTLDLGNLEELFLKETDKKMRAAGIHSCHKTCIKILKVLFTGLLRKSLLDRGELNSRMIETVVYYLLLESSPEQWAFSFISDRVSDAYLYLKSALETGRLPNFFINNPHLLKQMPFLTCYPLLLKGKQQNLLSDSRLETVDKKLNYMKDRIKETGLEDCFKDTYSPDTWEYEFFVYS